ncbi:MAG: hypothetical protein SFW36_08445 [Leptolyngbyaceae cyanobacterium bins.59]|nr:hypothetical protein [Leptolyngbyaceae cyanobacterium bins.59]
MAINLFGVAERRDESMAKTLMESSTIAKNHPLNQQRHNFLA